MAWGPPLWRILHTVAEKLGTNSNPYVAKDVHRTWLQLLVAVENIMPCAMCRKHYHLWLIQHPVSQIRADDIQRLSREWLWNLHQNVNLQRGVEGMPLEAVEGTYATMNIQQDVTALANILRDHTQRGLNPIPVRIWHATLRILRQLLGI